MNTLAELKSGRLNGVTRLQLVEGLTQFPLEILMRHTLLLFYTHSTGNQFSVAQ